MPYQLALQMPRHPPGGETISLVVPPRGFVETRRNSSSERKKSHEAMRLCRSLAIGACSCWVRRGGLQPHSLAWGSPRPKDAGKSPRQISGGWGGRNEQAFCCLMLVFHTELELHVCSRTGLEGITERQDESCRGRQKISCASALHLAWHAACDPLPPEIHLKRASLTKGNSAGLLPAQPQKSLSSASDGSVPCAAPHQAACQSTAHHTRYCSNAMHNVRKETEITVNKTHFLMVVLSIITTSLQAL